MGISMLEEKLYPKVGSREYLVLRHLQSSLAIVDKRRSAPNKAEVMNVIGDVDGSDVVIVDDMIDTAGTTVNAASAAIENGVFNAHFRKKRLMPGPKKT